MSRQVPPELVKKEEREEVRRRPICLKDQSTVVGVSGQVFRQVPLEVYGVSKTVKARRVHRYERVVAEPIAQLLFIA